MYLYLPLRSSSWKWDSFFMLEIKISKNSFKVVTTRSSQHIKSIIISFSPLIFYNDDLFLSLSYSLLVVFDPPFSFSSSSLSLPIQELAYYCFSFWSMHNSHRVSDKYSGCVGIVCFSILIAYSTSSVKNTMFLGLYLISHLTFKLCNYYKKILGLTRRRFIIM